jgi:hypothetical protein
MPVRFLFETGIDQVIRSELLAKLRQENPHLTALAAKKALDTMLDEITDTLSQGTGWSCAGSAVFSARSGSLVWAAIRGPESP